MNTLLFDEIMSARNCRSDSDCAREIGVHRSTISRLREKTCSPTGAVMFQIAEALGVRVDVLFTRTKEQQS